MTTVYQYRIYCNTEAQWVYTWGTSAPMACPNNTSHDINANSIMAIDSVSSTQVSILAENGNLKTGGNFRSSTINFVAAQNSTTVHSTSFPIPIALSNVQFHFTEQSVGDMIDCCCSQNTAIGATTADINAGVTTIPVSQDVITNIMVGFYVNITDGTNNDQLNRVITINSADNTIIVETATVNSFLTGATIQMSAYNVKDYFINTSQIHRIAYGRIGSRYIPANTVGTITYKNNSNVSKTICIMFEYFY
jgi:hypothetical protein